MLAKSDIIRKYCSARAIFDYSSTVLKTWFILSIMSFANSKDVLSVFFGQEMTVKVLHPIIKENLTINLYKNIYIKDHPLLMVSRPDHLN